MKRRSVLPALLTVLVSAALLFAALAVFSLAWEAGRG